MDKQHQQGQQGGQQVGQQQQKTDKESQQGDLNQSGKQPGAGGTKDTKEDIKTE